MTNTENTIGEAFAALKASELEVTRAVVAAREEGSSWENIGHVLGISKQAAHQKYSDIVAGWQAAAKAEAAQNTHTKTTKKVDAKAPAKTPSRKIDPFMPALRQHGASLPKPTPTTAQPGTGKGPHLCTGCGSTNHHGSTRGTIAWNDGCRPTKYDTPAETDYLNARTK